MNGLTTAAELKARADELFAAGDTTRARVYLRLAEVAFAKEQAQEDTPVIDQNWLSAQTTPWLLDQLGGGDDVYRQTLVGLSRAELEARFVAEAAADPDYWGGGAE